MSMWALLLLRHFITVTAFAVQPAFVESVHSVLQGQSPFGGFPAAFQGGIGTQYNSVVGLVAANIGIPGPFLLYHLVGEEGAGN